MSEHPFLHSEFISHIELKILNALFDTLILFEYFNYMNVKLRDCTEYYIRIQQIENYPQIKLLMNTGRQHIC